MRRASLATWFILLLLLYLIIFLLRNETSPKQCLHKFDMKITKSVPKPSPPVDITVVLPNLTLEAQDSFYGAGCKESSYRKSLQVLLGEWKSLARRRNITYFICFGSFLGSVRNGDLIPYDTDVDVCMFRDEYHKLAPEESRRPVNLNDGKIHLLLQRHSPNPRPNTPRRNCRGKIVRNVADDCSILNPHGRLYKKALIYIDIFLLEDMGAQFWDEYRDRIHDRHTILPLRPCTYLGLETKCPNNKTKYLETYYGKDYLIPQKICLNGSWQVDKSKV